MVSSWTHRSVMPLAVRDAAWRRCTAGGDQSCPNRPIGPVPPTEGKRCVCGRRDAPEDRDLQPSKGSGSAGPGASVSFTSGSDVADQCQSPEGVSADRRRYRKEASRRQNAHFFRLVTRTTLSCRAGRYLLLDPVTPPMRRRSHALVGDSAATRQCRQHLWQRYPPRHFCPTGRAMVPAIAGGNRPSATAERRNSNIAGGVTEPSVPVVTPQAPRAAHLRRREGRAIVRAARVKSMSFFQEEAWVPSTCGGQDVLRQGIALGKPAPAASAVMR